MILRKIQKLSLWKQGMINGLMLGIAIDLPFLTYILYDAATEYLKTLMPSNESYYVCGGEIGRNYSGFVILPVILSLGIGFVCAIIQRSSLMRLKSKVFLWQIIGVIWFSTLPFWASVMNFVSLLWIYCYWELANDVGCQDVIFTLRLQLTWNLTWLDLTQFSVALGAVLLFNLFFALIFCRRDAVLR